MSADTNDEGVFVGKGPAVSAGDVVQVPEFVPPEVLAASALSFLHALASGAMAAKPKAAIKPFFKKSFLSVKLFNACK